MQRNSGGLANCQILISTLSSTWNGDSVWLAAFTADGELLADDEALRSLNPRCSRIKTVDIAREHDNDKNVREIKKILRSK